MKKLCGKCRKEMDWNPFQKFFKCPKCKWESKEGDFKSEFLTFGSK